MYPRHRWAVVLGAICFVAVVEALSDSLLDAALPFPRNAIFVTGIVAAVAMVAAWFAFRLIDRLTADLLQRHEDLQSSNAALRAVYDVSLAVSTETDLDVTMAMIVDRARRLLDVDAALLVLGGPDGEMRLRASNAKPGVIAAVAAGDDGRSRVGRDGMAGAGCSPSGGLASYLAPGYQVGLEAPVGHGTSGVGVLGVATTAPREFCQADVETLTALATQVGLALEAARLRAEIKLLAVQGERERIAREMHDGLAQVLGYVNTKSQAVGQLLADGKVPEASRQLGELAAAARSVYADVREAILNLAPPASFDGGLAAALEEYAARWAESSKLAVRFQATPEAREASLPQDVGYEVFGVAREALTNVRKHAHARRVGVSLTRAGDELVLLISDDGVGFDPNAISAGPERWPHFGLAGMRERAQAVGGRIEWRSKLGSGAEVELCVPVSGESFPPAGQDPVPSGRGAASNTHQVGQSPAPARSKADSGRVKT
jgi:signal transduction histidine kinase